MYGSTRNRVLLDTNAAISIMQKQHEIKPHIAGKAVYLSTISLGELYFGVEKSQRVRQNLAQLDEFVRSVVVLPCDCFQARLYGRLCGQLRSAGKMIPVNDIWIAAAAQRYFLTLLTRDKHFEQVESLSVQSW